MNRSLHQPFLAGEAGMGLSAYIAAQQFSALIGIHGTASVDLWNLKAEVRGSTRGYVFLSLMSQISDCMLQLDVLRSLEDNYFGEENIGKPTCCVALATLEPCCVLSSWLHIEAGTVGHAGFAFLFREIFLSLC